MKVLLAITEMIMLPCAGILSLLIPFMLVIAWARTIVSLGEHRFPLAWKTLAIVLFAPIALAFFASIFVVHGPIAELPSSWDYLLFNYHPLWWVISLIGLALLHLQPERKRVIRIATLFAAILYLVVLLSAPLFLKGIYSAGEVIPQSNLGTPFMYFGIFANPFVTFTFLLVSALRPNKNLSGYGLVISLGFSAICAFLYAVFPFHLD